jgi:DNA-binding transcriptional LysR family regulator
MSNIKQIETLYWTIKLGTLQRAANKMFVTQSAATKRLKELEKRAFLPLFEDNAQKSSLTPKGEEVMSAAEAVLDSLRSLEDLRESAPRTIRTLRIGISELVTLTWFSSFVQNLNSVYPNVSLLPDVDVSARLQQKLLKGDLDLAVVPGDYVTTDMESLPIDSVDFAWLAPAGSFKQDMPLSLKALSRLPVIVQGPDSGITTRCDQLFAEAGIEYTRVYGSDSLFALASLIRAGVGVSCVPRGLFAKEIASGQFQEVTLEQGIQPVEYHLAFMKHDQRALGFLMASLARRSVDASRSAVVQ